MGGSKTKHGGALHSPTQASVRNSSTAAFVPVESAGEWRESRECGRGGGDDSCYRQGHTGRGAVRREVRDHAREGRPARGCGARVTPKPHGCSSRLLGVNPSHEGGDNHGCLFPPLGSMWFPAWSPKSLRFPTHFSTYGSAEAKRSQSRSYILWRAQSSLPARLETRVALSPALQSLAVLSFVAGDDCARCQASGH